MRKAQAEYQASMARLRIATAQTAARLGNERRLKELSAKGPAVAPPTPPPSPSNVFVRDRVLDKTFASFGEQLLAIRDAGLDPAWRKVDPRLLELNARAASGASETVPSDGGFMLAPEFAEQIAVRIYSTGQLLQRFQYFPISSINTNAMVIPSFDEQNRADGSRFGGVKSAWVNEASTLSATKPKYRNIQLTLKKLLAISYATDELMSDAATLGAALQLAFGNELAFKAEQSSLFGDGSGKPLGMLNAGNPALITVAKDSNQAAATITASNLINMYTRMWGPGRRNAIWVVSESVDTALINTFIPAKNVAGTENVGGVALYKPAESDDDFPRILGRPVMVTEYSPVIGQLGDVAFIDPSQYAWAEKSGPDFSTSIHLNFLTGESTYKSVWRVDGSPMWNAPVNPYNSGSTLSAYVTLSAR